MNKSCVASVGSVASLMFLCGCASIISKSQRPVTITSSPQGAKVTLSKENGVAVHTGETPMTVTLETSRGFFKKAKYKIEASKPGYEMATSSVAAEINGWYFGNLLFGGVIGMLIVDPATGAMWRLEDTYSLSLPKAQKVTLQGGKSVNAVSIHEIPLNLRSRMVRVVEQSVSQ